MDEAERKQPRLCLLHQAARDGDYELVDRCLKAGAYVNSRSTIAWTPLHRACGVGAARVVSRLLESGADVDAKDECGETPLHIACFKGYAKCVRLLLKEGAKPNERSLCGRQPLHEACRVDDYSNCTRALLEFGAEADVNNRDCNSTFRYALSKKCRRSVSLIRRAAKLRREGVWSVDWTPSTHHLLVRNDRIRVRDVVMTVFLLTRTRHLADDVAIAILRSFAGLVEEFVPWRV